KVVRHGDNRAVCNARVHICEVDRIPWLIRKLPDAKVLRLRDDFFHIIRNPPIPPPGPDPGPLAPGSRRHPAPLKRSTFRFAEAPSALVGFSPQRGPPGESAALPPQPLPPRERSLLSPELHAGLRSTSTLVVRNTLVENWKLLIPWLCLWPHWWW